MSADQSVNFQSLNVVRDELIATIEDAARDLEMFVSSNQEDVRALQSSVDGIQQIAGILKVLELTGATMLSDELYTIATDISPGAFGSGFEKKMEVVSNTFFVLSRYLEYLQQTKKPTPDVLVPHINALRKLRSEPAISESHFLHFAIPKRLPTVDVAKVDIDPQKFSSEVRRLRQMYQIGLIGLLREKQLPRSYALMRRAVKRLQTYTGSEAPIATLWHLADTTLDAMSSNKMIPLETRKFLFMRIDTILRQVQSSGITALEAKPPISLVKELLYLIVLSQHTSANAQAIQGACSNIVLTYSETELHKRYAALYGPSVHTVSSLAEVMQTEILNAKRTLENAALNGGENIEDLNSFISVLVNVSEILSVIGLNNASANLKQQIEIVRTWDRNTGPIPNEELTDVANNLLYLESTMQSLSSGEIGIDGNSTDINSQDSHIASNELTSAVTIVIGECLAGLALTKRGLNAFSDSNYDVGHIKNISKTLNGISGAMSLLKHERVMFILHNCVDFVEEILLQREPPAAIDEYLETFADVIIAIEYYFDSATRSGEMDESVLQIAEDSLSALGFPE